MMHSLRLYGKGVHQEAPVRSIQVLVKVLPIVRSLRDLQFQLVFTRLFHIPFSISPYLFPKGSYPAPNQTKGG